MRIYISGGITGVPDFKKKFDQAAKEVEAKGYEVINPALVDLPKSCNWNDYMTITLEMLKLADGIYMMDN